MKNSLTLIIAVILTTTCAAFAQDGWQKIEFPLPDDVTGCCFLSDDTGHLVTSSGKHARTFDGGENWWGRQVTNHIPLEDVHFLDAMFGYVCGRQGEVHFTTDGGNVWYNISRSDTAVDFVSVRLLNTDTVLLTGLRYTEETRIAESVLLRSIDGGKSWNNIEIPGMAVAELSMDGNTLYCLSLGFLHQSDDDGKTWQSSRLDFEQPGRTVVFSDNHGLVAGNHNMCAFSDDGGKSWKALEFVTQSHHFICADMADDSTAVIAGTNGMILTSGNWGKSWVEHSVGTRIHVLDLDITPNYIWAVGTASTVVRLAR